MRQCRPPPVLARAGHPILNPTSEAVTVEELGRHDLVLPPAGLAFAECLRAYVAEIAERGFPPAITNADSEAGKSDSTGAGTWE